MKLMLDERNLARQPLFWAAILVPLILFFAFGFPIWQGLSISFSENAYKKILEINKFPLYIFGTSVPLVAIVAYMHRTIQTEKQILYTQEQIKLTDSKNKADSYYAHIKFVVDGIKSFPDANIKCESHELGEITDNFTFNQPYALYKKIFPRSNIDKGYSKAIDEDFRIELRTYFYNINNALYKAETNDNQQDNINIITDALCEIDVHVQGLCDLLLLDYNQRDHLFWSQENTVGFVTSFGDEKQLKSTLTHLFRTIERLCDFIGLDEKFLFPHPLADREHAFKFYVKSETTLFDMILPAGLPAESKTYMGRRK